MYKFVICLLIMDNNRKRKLNTLELHKKYELIKDVEKGNMKKKDIALKYGILPNTLTNILSKKDSIIKNFENGNFNNAKKQRIRACTHEDVDAILLSWFKDARNSNLPLNGPILVEKANLIAKSMDIEKEIKESFTDM